jgi:hypothetical protein
MMTQRRGEAGDGEFFHAQMTWSTEKRDGLRQNDAGEDRVVHDAFYRAGARHQERDGRRGEVLIHRF